MSRSFTRQILVSSFIFAMFIIGMVGTMWLYNSSRLHQQLIDIRDRYEITRLLHEMSDASRMRALSSHRMYFMDDLIERFEEQSAFSAHADQFMTARDALLTHPAFSDKDRAAWDAASVMVGNGAKLHNEVVKYLIEENNELASRILRERARHVQDGFINKFNEILKNKHIEINSIVTETEQINNAFFNKLVFIGVISVLIIVGVFAYAYRYTINAENTLRKAHELEKGENQYKTEFLARVSHELRTPLNAILGFAQVINMDQDNKLPKEHAMYFKHIEQAGWQLLSLVDNILDITMICEGRVKLTITEVNLPEQIQKCCSSLGAAAKEGEVSVNFSSDSSDIERISSDCARVNQIMENLVSNAIKYNRPGGTVDVSLSRASEESIKIEVINTGDGITDENLKRLFKPFSTVGELQKQDGRGIGLVLTKALVECLNGSIGVHSVPGEITTFSIELPLAYVEHSKPSMSLLQRIAG